ncbi:putative histone deacetylase-like protein [Metschnikowia bicuspidata]|uniref:NAD-dependent protein deacetylase n=1 Tax=Metschnikowia bicuspidata TaxID=27322 RepID=A0A4P9ZGA4_9ASCO|nr:putative histone deacetylase-like protein [Metschnikowia bicuspidata]
MENKLQPLVDALQLGKKAVFFLGAGVSTSCKIPDFRSPKTGLYAQLERLRLPYPEAVFDIDYFRRNPKAFYALCKELYPGKIFPSAFHFLLRLLQEKGLLHRVYTQNIDTLEQLAGVDPAKIVAAHGSFADNHCIDCLERMSPDTLIAQMDDTTNDGIPTCAKCGGFVKPNIVFYGEGLPMQFFECWEADSDSIDVAIVAGTSLTVYPFAGLPAECPKRALRVLINNEVVGDFKQNRRKSDLVLQKSCDEAAVLLALQLGWKEELEELIAVEIKKFYARSKRPSPEEKEPKEESMKEKEKKLSELQQAEQSDLEHKLEKLALDES